MAKAIPRVPPGKDTERTRFDSAVKERLEVLSGVRGTEIKPLSNSATTEEIIATVNEMLSRLQ